MKLTIPEHIAACAVVAKKYTNKLIGQLAETVVDALEELEGKLKQVAYSGSYNDLDDTPTSLKNPEALTITMNNSASTYDGSVAKNTSFYAPTTGGTAGYELVSNGATSAPVWKKPPYATCSTTAATVAKTASMTNFKLTTGVTVKVKFSYVNTATTPTLNVNSTGAKSIVHYSGTTAKTLTSSDTWVAGETVEFLYNGTYWVIISSDQSFVHPNNEKVKEHTSSSILSENGAHNLRYYNGKLQYEDDDGTWKTLSIADLLI